MPTVRHFLPWDRPLLPQAVDYLAKEWKGDGPLNLAEILVVVPTRQSGRRLREALAAHASSRGKAVFPPRVMLPESLVAAGAKQLDVASRLESQLAWIDVFRGLDLENFRAVFPVDPPSRNFSWARRLAQEFSRLQSTLAETGLRLADVAARAGANFPEVERWNQIAQLEELQAARLKEIGRVDIQAAKLERARVPSLPEGIRRIILLGTPDPLPLALTILEIHAPTLPVEVVIFAPKTEASSFDAWGRPVPSAWEKRIFDLPKFEERVKLCADPEDQAEKISRVVRGYPEADGLIAVGSADAEVLPLLENALGHAGLKTFNPEGDARRSDGLYQLLDALAGLAGEASFAAVETLSRCPDFLSFLQGRSGNFSGAMYLAMLDQLRADHLPPDLTEARRHAPESRELAAISELRAQLTTGRFPENASSALATLFEKRRFNLSIPADALAAEAAEAWTEVMREIAVATKKFSEITNEEWWELALGFFGETTRYDDKEVGAVELQGWLELLWEDAPHLMIAGFNDGRVPDSVVGDPFLPEALRALLGVKTNSARFARDAYLLQALAKCREQEGRLDLLLGKTSAAGDPIRPSRLLFCCADAELPARVAFLFSLPETARPNPSWRRAWQLTPQRKSAPERMAVTALRDWLACPFRFYLSRVLRLRAIDSEKSELDPMDFGNICHAALETMGRSLELRDCTDGAVIRDFLLAELSRNTEERYGSSLTLPLLVQLESARQRLTRAAEVQAQTRAEGWVTLEVERAIQLEVGRMTVTGKIDRIDRHETTRAIRVLDYKTADRLILPREAHLRGVSRDETPPDFARFPNASGKEVWKDLQLPLYLRALAAEFPGEIDGGYFHLPKASTETRISLWDDYTREMAESAWSCAQGVADAIQAGKFWPPNESIRAEQDPFAELFHQGAASSIAGMEVTP